MSSALRDYIGSTLIYQLQILPDTLLMGAIILAIVLANPTIIALAAGCAATQGITHAAAGAVAATQPNATVIRSTLDTCTGGYVGRTWGRLFRTGTESLWHPYSPSVYMATIGYFALYGAALSQLYQEELAAGMMPRSTLIAMGVITFVVVVIATIFRVGSGCESVLGAIGGLALGGLLGYVSAILVGYFTDRRGSNIWGIPLLRGRINAGSAVYVCPK